MSRVNLEQYGAMLCATHTSANSTLFTAKGAWHCVQGGWAHRRLLLMRKSSGMPCKAKGAQLLQIALALLGREVDPPKAVRTASTGADCARPPMVRIFRNPASTKVTSGPGGLRTSATCVGASKHPALLPAAHIWLAAVTKALGCRDANATAQVARAEVLPNILLPLLLSPGAGLHELCGLGGCMQGVPPVRLFQLCSPPAAPHRRAVGPLPQMLMPAVVA